MPLPNFLQRFRSGAPVPPPAPLSSADIEQARIRARRRMIGMAVLVGVGVIGFPWLFETQPRPLSHDVQVVSAATSAPVAAVSTSAVAHVARVAVVEPERSPVVAAPERVDPDEGIASRPEIAPEERKPAVPRPVEVQPQAVPRPVPVSPRPAQAKASTPVKVAVAPKPVPKPVAKPIVKPDTDTVTKAASKPAVAPVKPAAVAKAPIKPEAKPAEVKADSKATEDTRYIVQVGAFSDGPSAHTARMKVERLGIKTYTQAVETPTGKKIRVRIGPYASKAEADKAMATLRKAGVVGNLLTL
ncbi:MAG TPA: SPOR domain-containing protein [Aquabacterium sp.]|nr:SPOR domain-containing protein [Aquabacterium sp.]